MAILSYLANIKSSGVYYYVWDKSEVPVEIDRRALRMVIGYSEIGPFNTPVYVGSGSDFTKIFGRPSRRLERRGIYFHRMALQALEAGPIIALNIKPFNIDKANPEHAAICSFNAADLGKDKPTQEVKAALVAATTRGQRDAGITSIYDTNRFWKVDGNHLHDIQMMNVNKYGLMDRRVSPEEGSKDYIRIVQTSDKGDSNTIFVRPFVPSGWDIKVSDWYSAASEDEMPAYMDPIKDHSLSEYFAEVYVFKGDLRSEDLFKHTGTLGSTLPVQFKYAHDDKGNALYWDISRLYPILEKVVTYNENGEQEEFIVSAPTADQAYFTPDGTPVTVEKDKTGRIIYKANGTEVKEVVTTQPWAVITEDIKAGRSWIKYMNKSIDELTISPADEKHGKLAGWNLIIGSKATGSVDPVGCDNCAENKKLQLTPEEIKGTAQMPDHIATATDEAYLAWQPFCIVEGNKVRSNGKYRTPWGELGDAIEEMSTVTTANFLGRYSGILFPGFKDATGSTASLDAIFNADYARHKMLMGFDETLLDAACDADTNSSLRYGDKAGEPCGMHTKSDILSQGKKENCYASPAAFLHALTSPTRQFNWTEVNGSRKTNLLFGDKVTDYPEVTWDPNGSSIYGWYMEGYNYSSIKKSDKDKELQDKIFTVLGYKGLREALVNNVDVDYHYIVDTFNTYPGFGMKSVLTQIAKDKDNCLLLTSFPQMPDILRRCGVENYLGGFDMKKVRQNGISLPTEVQGASWAAMYTQLTYTDGSSKFIAPSVGLVSNLYITKNAYRQPYYVVAGPNNGLIKHRDIVGPDYNYIRADLNILEPMGVNVIVHMPRYGIVINSNQTMKQVPVTALSKVHVRELVIYLQNSLEHMLRGYQWEMNTPDLRQRVETHAKTILEQVKANRGIYDYDAKCDGENNTPEIIDNELIVLDVDIEPARAMGKAAVTITLHRTGGMAKLGII